MAAARSETDEAGAIPFYARPTAEAQERVEGYLGATAFGEHVPSLPTVDILTAFSNQTLDFVTFASNKVHFYFSGSLSVGAMGPYEYDSPQLERLREEPPVLSSSVMQFIDRTVSKVSLDASSALSICFVDGGRITISRENHGYESYSVHVGDHDFYV